MKRPLDIQHRGQIDRSLVAQIGTIEASFTYEYIRDQDERAKIDSAVARVYVHKKYIARDTKSFEKCSKRNY